MPCAPFGYEQVSNFIANITVAAALTVLLSYSAPWRARERQDESQLGQGGLYPWSLASAVLGCLLQGERLERVPCGRFLHLIPDTPFVRVCQPSQVTGLVVQGPGEGIQLAGRSLQEIPPHFVKLTTYGLQKPFVMCCQKCPSQQEVQARVSRKRLRSGAFVRLFVPEARLLRPHEFIESPPIDPGSIIDRRRKEGVPRTSHL